VAPPPPATVRAVDIHTEAAVGFTAGADEYERGRPSYPVEAVDRLAGELGIGPDRSVLDLAAGTGKWTRLVVDRGARVVAVEPVAAMRAILARQVPQAAVLPGTAEALPVADASVDVVTVAQAFHWFRSGEALAEIARILRPGGGLGLIWNERDDTVGWVARISALIDSVADAPYGKDDDLAATVAGSGRFTPVQHRRFAFGHEVDAGVLVDRVLSTSFVASRPAAEKAALAGEVRRTVADLPTRFRLPYVTDVYWCRRR
jgi:SAM-dependent methyltransferase